MSNPELPTEYYIFLPFRNELVDSIFKDEFNLQFESETKRLYDQEMWIERGPAEIQTQEYNVRIFKSVSNGDKVELVGLGSRGIFNLNSNNSHLLKEISTRFAFFGVDLEYTIQEEQKVSLENLKNNFEKINSDYVWFFESDGPAVTLLSQTHNIPEFIQLKNYSGDPLRISFLFPKQPQYEKLSELYDDYRRTSHTEQLIPSNQKATFKELHLQVSKILNLAPGMREFHEFILSQGFKEQFGRQS